jgi:glutaredoxin
MIKVYSTPWCSSCSQLKRYFKDKKIDYTEVDLDKYPERSQEVIDLCGMFTVPVTVVEKAGELPRIVTGYNISSLSACLN